jgi:DNA-binding transcriptional LysR family regulator
MYKRIISLSLNRKIDMKLTLRQLEVFAAIARSENVSRAAATLAMSQSAASSALVELERQFDCPLFDRIGKSLRLNSTGRGLLAQAEDLLARAAGIEGYLAGGTLGPLVVGATLTIGNYLATLVVAEYLQRHPASKIGLHVANTHDIVERLRRCELDIGLIEGETHDPELLLEPWLDDALVVFCAPSIRWPPPGPPTQACWRHRTGSSANGARAPAPCSTRWLPALCPICASSWNWSTPKRSSGRSNPVWVSVACRACRCARHSGAAAWSRSATPQFDLSRHFYFARHRQRHVSQAMQAFLSLCRESSGTARSTDTLELPFIR